MQIIQQLMMKCCMSAILKMTAILEDALRNDSLLSMKYVKPPKIVSIPNKPHFHSIATHNLAQNVYNIWDKEAYGGHFGKSYHTHCG